MGEVMKRLAIFCFVFSFGVLENIHAAGAASGRTPAKAPVLKPSPTPKVADPAVLGLSPDPAKILTSRKISLSGSVDNEKNTLFVLGRQVALKGKKFTLPLNLKEGSNPITIEVRNRQGKKVLKTLNYRVMADKPQVTFENLKPGGFYKSKKLRLKGRVNQDLKRLRVNNRDVAVKNGAFETEVELPEGKATVTTQAENIVGIAAASSVPVTIDTTPPQARVLNVNADQPLNASKKTVEFIAFDKNLKSVKLTVTPGKGK